MIVVTDDREIQRHVKALGARVWSVKDFISRLSKRSAFREGQAVSLPGAGKTISKTLEFKINQELEKIWLEKRKNN